MSIGTDVSIEGIENLEIYPVGTGTTGYFSYWAEKRNGLGE